MVLSVVLPVIYVYIWETGDEQLQFLLIEDRDQFWSYNVMEA